MRIEDMAVESCAHDLGSVLSPLNKREDYDASYVTVIVCCIVFVNLFSCCKGWNIITYFLGIVLDVIEYMILWGWDLSLKTHGNCFWQYFFFFFGLPIGSGRIQDIDLMHHISDLLAHRHCRNQEFDIV